MPTRPPLSQLIIYALGQLGWSLAAFGAANLLVYFYLPPGTADNAVFPAFIFQGAILGIGTLIGLINFGGRIFDAITDPWIAAWSDNRSAKGGKRKKALALAALPFAAFSFLIFYPPVDVVSEWNAIWLIVTVFLFYFFLTLYVVPYTALISELGHHPPDRMLISTLISVTWALGFVIGGMAYGIQTYFEQFTEAVPAFQMTVGLFAIISLLFMLVPVFFLKEESYAYQPEKTEVLKPSAALRSVFADRNFRLFMVSDLMYWLSLTFIQQGVSYYVTVLFGLPKEQASVFLGISFAASFVLYWPVNKAVKRYGKRLLILSAFLVFFLVFALTASLSYLPISKEVMFYVLATLSAYPLAVFGIVPNALVADFIYQHEQISGQQQAGMFYAVRNFMLKIGISLALLLFPSFLLLGKSVSNPKGVEVSAIAACFFCLIGWAVFRQIKLTEVTETEA